MSSATATTNHDEIRKWVEDRGGHPAIVAPTESDDGGGVLRIDFDDPDDEEDVRLHRIKWAEFFEIFDSNDLAFLRGEGDSRFNKFISRDNADGA